MDRRGALGGDNVAVFSGWVLPALVLLLGGSAYLLAHAWGRLLPTSAPAAWALVGAGLFVSLVAFALAVGFALHPADAPQWWRPLIVVVVCVTGPAAALTGQAHLVPTALACAALMLLFARAGETLGRHLAPVLRLPGDYPHGDFARQSPETRRIVLETWVLSGLAAAAGGGPAVTAALALMAAGGLVLAAGAKFDTARRLAEREGFTWTTADRWLAWRGAGLAGLLALAVAVAVPGLPPLRTPAVFLLPLRLLQWLLRPVPDRTASLLAALKVHLPVPALPIPGLGVPGAAAGATPGFGPWPTRVAMLIVLALLALLVVEMRHWLPELRQNAARLWSALRSPGALWRLLLQWLRLRPLAAAWRPAATPTADARPRGRSPAEWLAALADPRLAVRAAYRRYLRAATAAGHPRAPSESPARYLERMLPLVNPAAAEADDLTHAYEAARFSRRPVAATGLPRVRAALARLLRRLRSPFGPGERL